jgi:hypothetical protein
VPLRADEVDVGDFNGDNDPDLVVLTNFFDPDGVNHRAVVFGWRGIAGGGFASPIRIDSNSNRIRDIAVGDFNRDGDTDLADGPDEEFLQILIGGPGFTWTQSSGLLSDGDHLEVADFNGDGGDDLLGIDCCRGPAVMFVHIGVFEGGGGAFVGGFQVPRSLAPGDFDKDGDTDVAVGADFDVSEPTGLDTADRAWGFMALNNGDASFADPTEFDIGLCCPGGMTAADFDGDTHLDLAVTNVDTRRNLSVLHGAPGATLGAPIRYLAGSGPSAVEHGDFNGDGKQDLAVANGARVSILLNRTGSAPSYRDVVLEDEPAGYWRFGEPSGSRAADETGINPGTYQGSYSLGRPGIVADDTAVALHGTTGLVRVPDSASLDTGDSFSLELWLKRAKLSSDVRPEGLFLKGFQLYLDANGAIVLRKPGSREIARTSTRITDTAQFHHVVATKDANTTRIYIDGVDVTRHTSFAAIADLNNALTIGAGAGGFRGTLDEAAVYDRALTSAEVTEHFNAR